MQPEEEARVKTEEARKWAEWKRLRAEEEAEERAAAQARAQAEEAEERARVQAEEQVLEQAEEQAHLALEDETEQKRQAFLTFVQQNFLVQPCFSCHAFTMAFLEISPDSRSILCQCVSCGRKMRAAAGTPEATLAGGLWRDLVTRYQSLGIPIGNVLLRFETLPAPLPYEHTFRTTIPEAIRAEVWRRDRGRCVNCGSKENLQFDHLIPVAQGGATSPKNLRLLCQGCNLSKGASRTRP